MSILHNHLRVRTRGASNPPTPTPHSLTDQHRRGRFEWLELILQRFNGGRSKLTWQVLTGDETWVLKLESIGNQDSQSQLQRSRSSQKKNGCLFLLKLRHRRHDSSWGQTDSHRGQARAPLSPEGLELWVQRRPETWLRGHFLHRENVIEYTAVTTADFLKESEVQLLPRPPCSPYLAPCSQKRRNSTKGRVPCWRALSWRRTMSVHEGCWKHTQINPD